VVGEERVAHPVLVQRLLGRAVDEVLESADPAGVARTLLSSVRELFRARADTEFDLSYPRGRRVVEVANSYRGRLRERGLVDPAEVLWEAARSSPHRRPVLVWGYPRLGPAEVARIFNNKGRK